MRDEVIVRRDPRAKFAHKGSRIALPDTAIERMTEAGVATVLRVGPKVTDLKPGDRILFDKMGTVGEENEYRVVPSEDDDVLRLPPEKVLGVIE